MHLFFGLELPQTPDMWAGCGYCGRDVHTPLPHVIKKPKYFIILFKQIINVYVRSVYGFVLFCFLGIGKLQL